MKPDLILDIGEFKMADNDGLLTNEEKNTYEKLIESIDNAGLTNETIHVEAEVTANTEKKIINL